MAEVARAARAVTARTCPGSEFYRVVLASTSESRASEKLEYARLIQASCNIESVCNSSELRRPSKDQAGSDTEVEAMLTDSQARKAPHR